MGINIGLKKLKGCYVGSKRVKEIYVGNNKVWPDEADSIGGGMDIEDERKEFLQIIHEANYTTLGKTYCSLILDIQNIKKGKKYILKFPENAYEKEKIFTVYTANSFSLNLYYIDITSATITLCDEDGSEITKLEWVFQG